MKQCFKCKSVLPLDEFYKNRGMKDGHLNKCKACTKLDAFLYRQENIEKIRVYDRARGNRQSPAYLKEYRARYPNKYRAHGIVQRAIRGGRLFPEPCHECGSEKAEAHHDDYAKPLNVRWLCSACHSQWHSMFGEAKNPS